MESLRANVVVLPRKAESSANLVEIPGFGRFRPVWTFDRQADEITVEIRITRNELVGLWYALIGHKIIIVDTSN